MARRDARVPVFRMPVPRAPAGPPPRRNAFPELDCLRDRLSVGEIALIERRALDAGVGAERVLVAHGIVDEDAYAATLARWLGWDYETFAQRSRACCPLDDDRLIEAARNGLLPLMINGALEFAVAPRNVRHLLAYAGKNPHLRFRITSAGRLNAFISEVAAQRLDVRAADALLAERPELSAGRRHRHGWMIGLPLLALLSGAVLIAPGQTIAVAETALAAFFLCWLALRLFGCFLKPRTADLAAIADRDLPMYTIIVPLYREAASVDALMGALRALDYPVEKLDIKLVTEPDDPETRAVLHRYDRIGRFESIVAPAAGPRTKPKALNAALPFARGTFVVVFDAEDRPESQQLRQAVAMFASEDATVACVQARLTIDNTADGWLARLFTAEYAAQFDLFLPGLARMGLPLPLGGSSNHFRTDVLRRIGAWDAYNVTEDADLGMRLARFGYRSAVLDSTTYEEAPATVGPWIRQRTRWFKGWIQTWAVHMRYPSRLVRDLGWPGFAALQLVVGGNVLASLIHPVFAGIIVHALATGRPLFGVNGIPEQLTWAFMASLVAGYLVTVITGVRGLKRRGLASSGWWLGLVVVHWLLLSLAAWRALLQFFGDPHGWEKTEHGLARSSRLAAAGGVPTRRPMHDRLTGSEVQRRDAA